MSSHEQLAALLTRGRSHRGAARLEAVLDPGRQFTRSEAERRLLRLVKAAGLPTPAANTRVAGYEVDFLWPRERLVVEVDGYSFHSARAAFERDRVRDADLQTCGYRVLRITWRRLAEAPDAVTATVATALAALPVLAA
jgi:very-short-patch-repair endonuclease